MYEQIIKNMNKNDKLLSEYACSNNKGIRIVYEENDIRPCYLRDADRIIYSLTYLRYIDKTQVFSTVKNDHISKRISHVNMVSKIARTIGRALNLNEDLIEAASLGHDLGHCPFGHVGESILNKLSLENHEGYFNHNVQSVRCLMNLENEGHGLNITLQVLDAILCHNGEFEIQKLTTKEKNFDKFLEEYKKTYHEENICRTLKPMTLEGCVVRISDIIAYIGRDIEDAIRLGVITSEDIPENIKNVLGSDNRTIINTLIMDIIYNSIDKNYIKMSDKVFAALKELKKFNYENIYSKANDEKRINEYKEMFKILFYKYISDIENKNVKSNIYKDFLNNKCAEYIKNNSTVRKVIDYISGMTDDYFINEYDIIKENK